MKSMFRKSIRHPAFTLIEMVLAMAIMAMIVSSLGILAKAVQDGSEFSNGYSTAIQYAHVINQRISDTVSEAQASSEFPAVLVVEASDSGWNFPDTLVVWSPVSTAFDPDGAPLVSELVIYTTDPANPNELWELTARSNASATPDASNSVAWQTLITTLKADPASTITVLADQLHTAEVTGVTTPGFQTLRPCLRFERRVLPTVSQWASYQLGSTRWDDLAWAQSIHGANQGLRQVWVRFEIQLVPAVEAGAQAPDDLPPLPFFGSATRTYLLSKN